MRVTCPSDLVVMANSRSQGVVPFKDPLCPRAKPVVHRGCYASFTVCRQRFGPRLFGRLRVNNRVGVVPAVVRSVTPTNFRCCSVVPSFCRPVSRIIAPCR